MSERIELEQLKSQVRANNASHLSEKEFQAKLLGDPWLIVLRKEGSRDQILCCMDVRNRVCQGNSHVNENDLYVHYTQEFHNGLMKSRGLTHVSGPYKVYAYRTSESQLSPRHWLTLLIAE